MKARRLLSLWFVSSMMSGSPVSSVDVSVCRTLGTLSAQIPDCVLKQHCSSSHFSSSIIIRCFHVNSAKHLIIKINLRVTLNALTSIHILVLFVCWSCFFSICILAPRCNQMHELLVGRVCHIRRSIKRSLSKTSRKLFISIES